MPGRPRWSFTIALVVVLVLVLGGVLLALPPRQSRDVALPPDDASPRQVVTTYLDAIDAHDCDTAIALTTANDRDGARSWCKDAARVRHVRIVSATGTVAGVSPGVGVVATYDVRWRPFHDNGAMDEDGIWGWNLVRRSPTGPWRIDSEGMG